MRFDDDRLFPLLTAVLLLFALLAGLALVTFVRSSTYGRRVEQIQGIGDLMPELFRD